MIGKKVIEFLLPSWIYKIISTIKYKLVELYKIQKTFRGERKCFGSNNPDVTFYVIRRRPPGAGLMSNYLHVLGHVKIADQRKMVPVVDMINYSTFYNEDALVNNSWNPWEYYFDQPNIKYTLEDVYKSKNVVLSSLEFPHHEVHYSIKDCENIKLIIKYSHYIKKYLTINKYAQEYIDCHVQKIKFKFSGVLGVSIRGTDYLRLRPKGHPIQPDIESVIKSVETLLKNNKIEKIFLSTEEEEVLEIFKNKFPDYVIAIDRMRVLSIDKKRHTEYKPGECISEVKFERHLDKYLTGLEYLTEMYLLSKCQYLLCGMTSGSAVAIFMNGGHYDEKQIFNLGLYP